MKPMTQDEFRLAVRKLANDKLDDFFGSDEYPASEDPADVPIVAQLAADWVADSVVEWVPNQKLIKRLKQFIADFVPSGSPNQEDFNEFFDIAAAIRDAKWARDENNNPVVEITLQCVERIF